MNKDELLGKVKTLGFTLGTYAVFGSGPLVVHQIREVSDIDIIVKPDVYQKLRQSSDWEIKNWPSGGEYLSKNIFEIAAGWHYLSAYQPDIDKLINEAELIQGIPFIRLEEVVKWKKAFGREKDFQDIKLIEEYFLSFKN